MPSMGTTCKAVDLTRESRSVRVQVRSAKEEHTTDPARLTQTVPGRATPVNNKEKLEENIDL